MTREQVSSYGAAAVTGGGSWLAQINQWTVMDWITVIGVAVGVLGVAVRAYCDISEHIDRKKQLGLEKGEK